METATKAYNQMNYSCASIASTISDCSDNSIDASQHIQPIHQRTQAEKKMDRILANRRSARRSRERKKQLQKNLQLSVAVLNKQNDDLVQENDELKRKLQIMSSLANQLTKQRQKSIASDKLALALLLQQMQPHGAMNAMSMYK